MSSNQNTLSTYLYNGLRGRNLKATFMVYLLTILLASPVAYLMVKTYDQNTLFRFLPLIVAFIIAFEYGLYFTFSRRGISMNSRKAEPVNSANLVKLQLQYDSAEYQLHDAEVHKVWFLDTAHAVLDIRASTYEAKTMTFLFLVLETKDTRAYRQVKLLTNIFDELHELMPTSSERDVKVLSSHDRTLKIELFGKNTVLTTMAVLLNSAKAMNESYGRENRICEVRETSKTVETLLGERLKQVGVVVPMTPEVQKASSNISRQLIRLFWDSYILSLELRTRIF